MLENAGIENDGEEELIVEREISSGGKSRAFVANLPVTTAFLRELAPTLGDIHGQNEQQMLFVPQAQRNLLDEYARAKELRGEVSRLFSQWIEACAKLEELKRTEQEKLRLLDLWSFQCKEIDAVQPRAGEDAALEADRKILQNVAKLQESAAAAFDLLYDSSESATTQVRQALKRLDELTRIDETLNDTANSLRQAALLLEEGAYELRDYLGKLEGDPARLEDVETRLASLDRLKRKYGRTIEETLAFRDEADKNIAEVENASEHRAALEARYAELAKDYEGKADQLSSVRASAAIQLSKAVESELKSLMMGGTRFSIVLNQGEWTSSGIDEIRFLVSPNRGEELLAVREGCIRRGTLTYCSSAEDGFGRGR